MGRPACNRFLSRSEFHHWVRMTLWIGADMNRLISLWHENYAPQRWHTFLVYLGFTIGAFILNQYFVKILPFIEHSAFIWSLSGIVIVCSVGPSCADCGRSSSLCLPVSLEITSLERQSLRHLPIRLG